MRLTNLTPLRHFVNPSTGIVAFVKVEVDFWHVPWIVERQFPPCCYVCLKNRPGKLIGSRGNYVGVFEKIPFKEKW